MRHTRVRVARERADCATNLYCIDEKLIQLLYSTAQASSALAEPVSEALLELEVARMDDPHHYRNSAIMRNR